MRNFLIRMFGLDYMSKLWGMNLKWTRSATIIYPSFVLTMAMIASGATESQLLCWVLGLIMSFALFMGFVYFEAFPIKYSECTDDEQRYQFGAGYNSDQLTKGGPVFTTYIVPFVMMNMLYFGLSLYENPWYIDVIAVLLIVLLLGSIFVRKKTLNSEDYKMSAEDHIDFIRASAVIDNIDDMRNYKPFRFIFHPVLTLIITIIILLFSGGMI